MSDSEPARPGPPPETWPVWVDDFVLPYLHNRALWLVFAAILAHVALAIVLVLLPVLRTQSLPAVGALLAFGMLSVSLLQAELRIRRKPAEFTLMLGLVWGTALVASLLLKDTGYL